MTKIETIKAYVDAFNAGDWVRMRALFTDDAVIRGVLGWGRLDEVLPVWRELHDGMAEHLEIEAVAQDGDTVVVRFKETGRFVGPFRGLQGQPPTRRPYEVVAIEWFEFAGDRIARRWGARDSAAISRQVLG